MQAAVIMPNLPAPVMGCRHHTSCYRSSRPAGALFALLLCSHVVPCCATLQVNLMEAEKQGLEHPEAFGLPPRPAAANSSSSKALPAPAADAAAATAGAVVSKDSKGSSGSKRSKGDGDDDDEAPGQVVDMVFAAPKAATYNLSLVAMSDCWVGADETVQVGRTDGIVGFWCGCMVALGWQVHSVLGAVAITGSCTLVSWCVSACRCRSKVARSVGCHWAGGDGMEVSLLKGEAAVPNGSSL
jgi:hypothetical protein